MYYRIGTILINEIDSRLCIKYKSKLMLKNEIGLKNGEYVNIKLEKVALNAYLPFKPYGIFIPTMQI